MKGIRHGDLFLGILSEAPKKLPEKSDSNVIMKGSHGHDHSYRGGDLYLYQTPKVDGDRVTIGYLKASKTKLFHVDHGDTIEDDIKSALIPDNWYVLRQQIEKTNEGMKIVID